MARHYDPSRDVWINNSDTNNIAAQLAALNGNGNVVNAGPAGLGDAQQAGSDIRGATYGAADAMRNDPRLNELIRNLDATIAGERLPYGQSSMDSELSTLSDMSAAGALNQQRNLDNFASARGINRNSPAYQARLDEINANRLLANQQGRQQVGQAAIQQNYAAQEMALNSAISERMARMNSANALGLAGAGYSAQVQTPVAYTDPTAGIYDMMNAMSQYQQQNPIPPMAPMAPMAPVAQQAVSPAPSPSPVAPQVQPLTASSWRAGPPMPLAQPLPQPQLSPFDIPPPLLMRPDPFGQRAPQSNAPSTQLLQPPQGNLPFQTPI